MSRYAPVWAAASLAATDAARGRVSPLADGRFPPRFSLPARPPDRSRDSWKIRNKAASAQDKLSSGPLAGHITRSGRDSPTAEEAVLSCEYEPHGLDGRLQLVVSSLQRRSDHCRLRQRPGVARACPDKSWRPVTMASWCLLLCFCGAQGPQPMVPQSTVPGRDACCWTAVRWPYIHIRG